eukprot:gb/GFBE01065597.1/.p1 GENE.gb/GFBE01065597.1/~~gb/GFBE01065597.1/.p1  ORF type:complete len:411 (+),score=14.10 gb/GFBE01065597.1/:1-1233(+)
MTLGGWGVVWLLWFATICFTSAVAKTQFVLSAGAAKCGTTQLYALVSSHPDVFSLRKELCPGEMIGFRVSETSITRAMGEMFQMATSLADNFTHLTIDQRCRSTGLDPTWCSRFVAGARPAASGHARIFFQSCINPRDSIRIQQAAPVLGAKVVYSIRDPASLLWASYNFWSNAGDTNFVQTELHGKWTQSDTYRSPEHFHEWIKSSGRLADSPHPGWYSWIGPGMMHLLQDVFGHANCFFFRAEDLSNEHTLTRLFDFMGLQLNKVPDTVKHARANTGTHLATRGIGVNSSVEDVGADQAGYEVSGFRPMLCDSRQLIYNMSREGCSELKTAFSIDYPDCFNQMLCPTLMLPQNTSNSEWHTDMWSEFMAFSITQLLLLVAAIGCYRHATKTHGHYAPATADVVGVALE